MLVSQFSTDVTRRLNSQSKFQMFMLYSGRHIAVHGCPQTWRFHTGPCKFLGNIYDEYLKFGETHRPKIWRSVLNSYFPEHTSHFLCFFHWLVFDFFFDFFFLLRGSENDLYTLRRTKQQLWNWVCKIRNTFPKIENFLSSSHITIHRELTPN